jgi:UDP-N-acetylmuramoyl-L-alanyl-D-glutamate--2,6-diaminopimelate ligase
VPLSVLLGEDALSGDVSVSGVQLDSRKVQPGDLFLAIAGEAYDGRQFIEQAVASGAAAVVAEAPVAGYVDDIQVPLRELPELRAEVGEIAARFYDQPSRAMHTVGVTGTNGKTTTTRLIAQMARALDKSCGVIGTLGATLGDDIAEAGNTTPDAVALQQQLGAWRDKAVDMACLEVSSHALVQDRVSGMSFDTAVFTNLSHDHLDYHGSLESYGRAKLQLFQWPGLQTAIVNLDDDYAPHVLASAAAADCCLTYSLQPDSTADLRFEDLDFGVRGVRGRLLTPWGEGEFSSPLPGDFNLANLAAAVASLIQAGEQLQEVLAVIASLQPVPGRMQALSNDSDIQVVIDYAHTPDALHQALRALRPHTAGRLLTVFGCGGDRDSDKRAIMGRIACDLSDRVIVTSDNPRNEDPLAIIADIEAGCLGNHSQQPDRALAIAGAVAEARAGDCVLIAGKGHEDYQLIEGQRLPFSDVQHATKALEGRATQ